MSEFFLKDSGGNMRRAYPSLGGAFAAYKIDHKCEMAKYDRLADMPLSLGVAFVDDDYRSPIFSIAPVDCFTNCTFKDLYKWDTWYDLDWLLAPLEF